MFSVFPYSGASFASAGGGAYYANNSESVSATASDVVSTLVIFVGLLQEAASAQDSGTVASSVFSADSAEQAEAADTSSSLLDYPVQIIEAVSGAEATTVNASTFGVFVSESAEASEELSAAIDFISQIQESVLATDAFISRILWETINTSEATNWQTIETAQFVLTSLQRGSFAENAFAGGPFAGGEIEYRIGQVVWSTVNSSQPTAWVVVETQT